MPDVHFRCVITKKRKKYRSIFIIHRRITFLYKKKKNLQEMINSFPSKGKKNSVRRSINFSTDYKFTREFLLAGVSAANQPFRSAGNSLIASSNREQLKRARKIMFWRGRVCRKSNFYARYDLFSASGTSYRHFPDQWTRENC